MAVLKKVGVLSFAKIEMLLFLVFGLLEGILVAVLFAIDPGHMALQVQELPQAGFGYAAIIILPLMYAVLGFLLGALGAWLYNTFAKLVGGIEVELETKGELKAVSPQRKK